MNSALRQGLGALALAVALGMAGGALAMPTESQQAPAPKASATDSDYAAGVKAVNGGNYADALAAFGKVVQQDPKNANAWNYIGFSNRKLGKFPDSLEAYEKALAINPDHLGANEYLGELYVQMGDMPKAEARLAKLNSLCSGGCPEYQALKDVIASKKRS